MNFNEHCIGKRLHLFCTKKVDINQLISFLQNNKNITELSLISCDIGYQIGYQEVEALAKGNLENLTSLILTSNNIGHQGAEALANSEHLKNLTTLNLESNYIGHQGAEALANSEHLKNLTTLSLGWNDIGYQSAEALANSENLKNLTTLSLGKYIGNEGVEALANSEHLKNLTTLSLGWNDIDDKGVKELAKLTNLTSLDLSNNSIGNEGAKELAKLTNLTSLILTSNNIGDKGAEALAKGNLENLTSLILTSNNIGDKGAEALAKGNLENLTSLILTSNNIGDKGAEALAKGNLKNLTSLNLKRNDINDKGAEALAKGNLENLTSLNLKRNDINDKGAEALANGNLKNLTSLKLENNGIFNQGAKALANLKNLTLLYLDRCTLEAQKALAESGKNVILSDFYYGLVQKAWSENSNASRLDENITKKLFFKLAMRGGVDWVVLLLNDLDKYPFLINSRDEEGHTLSHFYTHSPRMQELLFEHGLIPEQERNQRRDDERIARDSQSVHQSLVVKRTNFFAKKLVESTKASEGQLEQTVNSYVESIGLLKQYQNDPIRLRLLSLTDNEKKSAMKETLRETDPTPGDEKFIEAVVDKAEQALKQQYLKKNFRGEYDQGYPTNRMQYDYTRGSERFITIPESIGYIKLLIDNFSVPLKEKKELLVTLMEQNPDLVKNKLSKVKEKLGNSVILDKEQFNKTELHGLLNGIDDGKKVDELFKEISDLDIEKVWREQKEFVLLKQIYIAATTYGENSSACIQGTWSQIINSVNEISSEIVAQYDHYLEEEQKQEMQKGAITEKNIEQFLTGLTNILIQHVEFNPELKETLKDFAVCIVDIDQPKKITFEEQKILAEINKCFSKNIKDILHDYNRNIPSRSEYDLIIEGLSKVGMMQRFASAQESFNFPDNYLHFAAYNGYKDVVATLLEKGANVDKREADRWTSLHFAAYNGHKDVVITLLEKGANVDKREADGWTSLHFAAYNGHKDVVITLLEKGANPLINNKDGKTPRDLANDENIIQLLKEAETKQIISKAIKTGATLGIITALAIGIGYGIAGVGLPILAIAGIAITAALVVGTIAGGITYSVLKPSGKLDNPDLEQARERRKDHLFPSFHAFC